MTTTIQHENKMGIMPVNKLLFRMAVPMIISMLVQALYNIVDSIFVSMISENALTAVSLAFPVQNLMISIASGTCVGMNALLSRNLGEKNLKGVARVAGNGLFLTFINSVLFVIFGLTLSRLFFSTQTANTQIISMGDTYLTICSVFSFGLFGQITCERLLQATGKTVSSMVIQITGAVINIILDPILIFGLFGFPKMGITGAAVATAIGQCIGFFFGIYYNLRHNPEIKFYPEYLLPHRHTLIRIYQVGLPSIFMLSISSFITFGINSILIAFTSTATAVFGIIIKVFGIIILPILGINNSLVPIVAYNYGAKKKQRVIDAAKYGTIYATFIMILGIAIFLLFPVQIFALFNASDEMMTIGVPAMKIISFGLIFVGFSIICGSVFQALGEAFLSLVASLIRQVFVLLPAFYFLSLSGNLNVVWWGYPISEVASFVFCAYFSWGVYRKKIKYLGEKHSEAIV